VNNRIVAPAATSAVDATPSLPDDGFSCTGWLLRRKYSLSHSRA
jgi:hypothetical protein